MSEPHLPSAIVPFVPFPTPVSPPGVGALDNPICLTISADWIPYVLGALKALAMDSTWASSDPVAVKAAVQSANDLLDAIANYEACTVYVLVRSSPTDNRLWQLSQDNGATWQDFAVKVQNTLKTPVLGFENEVKSDVGAPIFQFDIVSGNASSAIDILVAT